MKRYTYWCDDGKGGGEWRVNTICGKEQCGPHVDRLATIEDILGEDYDLDRLLELVEADQDGRCVVLLRKPYYKLYSGYEIYIVEDGEVYMDYVQEVDLSESDHEKNKVEAWYYTGNDFAFTEREWGKTVFPTREDAEAALKGD